MVAFVCIRESRGLLPRAGIHKVIFDSWPARPWVCPKASILGESWICDPWRLALLLGSCKVYTFGHGNSFLFEQAVHATNRRCEIHSFDPGVTWAYNKPDYVSKHDQGLGLGNPRLHDIVRKLGHRGENIAILRVDCDGCEIRDLARELWSSRKYSSTNFTQVVVTITPSLAEKSVWDRGLFRPMVALGYVLFHSRAVSGRGDGVEEVSFFLQPDNSTTT